MSKTICALIAVGAALVFSGCAADQTRTASAGQSAGRACFFPSDVAGWKDASGGKFNLRTSRGEYYQAQFFSPCNDVDFTQQMTLITRASRRVCEGDDATLLLPGRLSGPDRCQVDQFRRMSDAEVAALRPVDKP